MPPHGKTIKKHRRYLDKVHMDIIFGDCVALGGYRYALLLVDVSTRYCWRCGLSSLTSKHIITALEAFRTDANGIPKKFHSDFDKKLIGGKALKWIRQQKSRVIAAPAGRQSSNGLAEQTWRTIVQMVHAYVTEKQVGREFCWKSRYCPASTCSGDYQRSLLRLVPTNVAKNSFGILCSLSTYSLLDCRIEEL